MHGTSFHLTQMHTQQLNSEPCLATYWHVFFRVGRNMAEHANPRTDRKLSLGLDLTLSMVLFVPELFLSRPCTVSYCLLDVIIACKPTALESCCERCVSHATQRRKWKLHSQYKATAGRGEKKKNEEWTFVMVAHRWWSDEREEHKPLKGEKRSIS